MNKAHRGSEISKIKTLRPIVIVIKIELYPLFIFYLFILTMIIVLNKLKGNTNKRIGKKFFSIQKAF